MKEPAEVIPALSHSGVSAPEFNPGRNQRLEPVNPWKNVLFKVYSVKVDSAFEEFTKKLASDPSTKVKDVTILQEDFFSLCRFSNSSCSVV